MTAHTPTMGASAYLRPPPPHTSRSERTWENLDMTSQAKWYTSAYKIYWAGEPPQEIVGADPHTIAQRYDIRVSEGGNLFFRSKGATEGGFFMCAPHTWRTIKFDGRDSDVLLNHQ